MAYIKTNWVDDVTELDAENMNHIEDGIFTAHNVELIAISDTAPTTCSTGDKYYNTEDNLIYTATGTNTWGATGEEPISGIFYILFSEQSSYSYDGTTLVSVGGGTEDIIISDTEPTSDDWKLWVDTGEVSAHASEITNSYSTSTGIGYSANYLNDKIEWEDITSQISMKTGYTLSSGKLFKKGKHIMGNIVVSGTFTQNTLATILELPYKADGEHITFCAFSDGAYSAKSLGYLYFVKNLSVSPNTTGQTYVNLELNYITE